MSVDGNWNITMSTPMGERNATLALQSAGNTLTGTQAADGNSGEIFDGTVNGNNIAWKISITNPMPLTLEFTGTVDGDSISGEMGVGWASTKENDREQWKAGDVEEDHLVDWEDTGLSHFPFMVAVEAAKEGKSQVERIIINSVDLAASRDGNRVIVGRVVEGQDVVEQIVQSQFSDAAELERGSGRPEETYTITSVTVE